MLLSETDRQPTAEDRFITCEWEQRRWLRRVKQGMVLLAPEGMTNRELLDYAEQIRAEYPAMSVKVTL